MELLLTLRKMEQLERAVTVADGIIVGKFFSSGYHFTMHEFNQIYSFCKARGCKFYIAMDGFVSENEKMLMYEYFDYIDSLEVDGIYFHDLGIYDAAKSYNLLSKLIYDGKTVLCNSLDTAFMLDKGIDSVVLSRELTLSEINTIVRNNPNRCDLQIFGHVRLSQSKRKFLSNYFREIHRDYDFLNKESLYLIEEKRDYRMPILEEESGTSIYSDYILEMFSEISDLRPYLKRGIIDTLFLEDEKQIFEVCRDYKRVSKENREFIKNSLYHNYPDVYSSGYLYQKTNITKDE